MGDCHKQNQRRQSCLDPSVKRAEAMGHMAPNQIIKVNKSVTPSR